jgi:membrane protein YdbS with pleckstrin-like domain
VFKEQWFWLIVLFVILIAIVPFVVIYFILLLPPIWGPALATVVLLVCWGVIGGYKDWVQAKRKEEEEKIRGGA